MARKPFSFFAHLDEYEHEERNALVIAAENVITAIEERRLPSGDQKLVVNAGMRNFREPWARDFGFAIHGLLELKEFEAARETLETFLEFQTPQGQFPIKVHSTGVIERTVFAILGRPQSIKKPLRPQYLSGNRTLSLDGNALLVSALIDYVQISGDAKFLKAYWPNLKRALLWLQTFAPDADRLLSQQPYSDWADSIARSGKILYTNVLYWKAVQDMARVAGDLGRSRDNHFYQRWADELSRSLKSYFWDAQRGYLVTSQEFSNLNASGNLMAICFGCVEPEKGNLILNKLAEYKMADPVPTKPVNFGYPRKRIALYAKLGRFPDYHVDAAWLWLGSWHVIALTRLNRLQEAGDLLKKIAHVIVRDKAVYEVYTPEGRYFSNFWYTSEAPLTWSAAMVLYAFHEFHRYWHQAQKGKVNSH
jgi:glycogen debranching enzyme